MWLLFSEEPPSNHIIQDYPYGLQKKPKKHEQRAYLTKNVSRHITVIPHIQPQPYIQVQSENKFNHCDSGCSYQLLENQWHTSRLLVNHSADNEAKSTTSCHRQKRISPKQYFQGIIKRPSYQEERQIFQKRFHYSVPPDVRIFM